MAAAEVREILSQQRADAPAVRFVLHFMGHSMGSLIIRGALPKILDKMDSIELGHFISLSSPHLGIQASWLQPLHAWRNLCWLSKPFSQQLAQLAVQDSWKKPFLLLARCPFRREVESLCERGVASPCTKEATKLTSYLCCFRFQRSCRLLHKKK